MTPKRSFTPNQQQAIETILGNLCVSAGAGSGKTTVLVERFMHLVNNGQATIPEILCITFTEKAAQEMLQRIVKRFQDQGDHRQAQAAQLANISTFHSFCLRILRENAIEARIDPQFRVLDEAEAYIWKMRTVKEWADDCYKKKREDVIDFFNRYQPGRVYREMLKTCAKLDSLGISADQLTHPEQDETLFEFLKNDLQIKIDAFVKQTDFIKPVSAALKRKIDTANELNHFIEKRITPRLIGWEDWMQLYDYGKAMGGNIATALKPFQKEVIRLIEELRGLWLAAITQEDLLTLKKCLDEFSQAYQNKKIQMGICDFDDLMRLARDLIRNNESIQHRYQNRFKYLMVDEFQDTNPLQMDILGLVSKGNNLFSVGDFKQSIYRFRFADVGIFQNTVATYDRAQDDMVVYLATNFRSRQEILLFCNEFFDALFDAFDFTYNPLNAGRKYLPREDPSVEINFFRSESNLKPDRCTEEAVFLANRIKEMVESGQPELTADFEAGATRPPDYGDIALLFRKKTHIPVFEEALRQAQVPFVNLIPGSLFDRAEIKIILNFLLAVDQPFNDIAMTAVLRSPIVALSDDSLLKIFQACREAKASCLSDWFLTLPDISAVKQPDQRNLQSFIDKWPALFQKKAGFSLADLAKYIVDEYRVRESCCYGRDSLRRIANVNKMMDLIADQETRTPLTLSEWIDYLTELDTAIGDQGEASLQVESGSVIITTVHRAKGLEFPIVFVPQMDSNFNLTISDLALLNDENEFVMKVLDESGEILLETPEYEAAKEDEKQKTLEEEIRVLYVAMTRAMEYLVLTGVKTEKDAERDKDKDDKNPWEWLRQYLNPPDGMEGVLVWETPDENSYLYRSVLPDLQTDDGTAKPQAPWRELRKLIQEKTDRGDVIREFTEKDDPDPLMQVDEIFTRLEVPTCETVKALPVFSYSQLVRRTKDLASDIESPMAEKDTEPQYWQEKYDGKLESARRLGIVLHSMLEHFPFGVPELERPYIDNFMAQFPEDEFAVRVRRLVESFIASDFYQKISKATGIYREARFSAPFENYVFEGIIDLVFKCDGRLYIADYKTSRYHPDSETAESYKRQVMAYGVALEKVLKVPLADGFLCYLPDEAIVTVPLNRVILNETREWLSERVKAALTRSA